MKTFVVKQKALQKKPQNNKPVNNASLKKGSKQTLQQPENNNGMLDIKRINLTKTPE